MINCQERKSYESPSVSVLQIKCLNLLNDASIQDALLYGDGEEFQPMQ